MLQTVMQLPLLSRTTSYSTSFQPRSDLSMMSWSHEPSALAASASSAAAFSAKPEPRPPSANPARISTG